MAESIAVYGDFEAREFRREIAWLARQYPCEFCSSLEEPRRDSESTSNPFVPDIVLLAQSTRGRFAETDVRGLRRRFPLARFMTLLGSWCEGESRSGTPIIGVERIYGHQFVSRMQAELRLKPSSKSSRPATISPEEYWLDNSQNGLLPNAKGTQVIVFAIDQSMAEAIASACCEVGFTAVATSHESPIAAPDTAIVIYDADRDRTRRSRDIVQLAQRFPNASIAVLIDFPRLDERQQALIDGAHAVVSKPFALTDLFTQLATFMDKR